jgi:hypothetical protein
MGMSGRIRQDLGYNSLCHVSGSLVLFQHDFNTQPWPDIGTPRSIHCEFSSRGDWLPKQQEVAPA